MSRLFGFSLSATESYAPPNFISSTPLPHGAVHVVSCVNECVTKKRKGNT
jgi:hypothetical protein